MKRSTLIIIFAAVIALIGAFIYLQKQNQNIPQTVTEINNNLVNATSSGSPNESSDSISTVKTFTLGIQNKKVVVGPQTLVVNQGDQVTIEITSNQSEEFHLHGYNKMVDLAANKTATLTFTADLSGRFTYELERSKTEIGALEVLPK